MLTSPQFKHKLSKHVHVFIRMIKLNTIGLFSKKDFLIIAFFTLLGAGGVFAATLITISTPDSQGAAYAAATACDENVTIRALTAPDAATGQLYVSTIALSDISQNATTGCGYKIMQIVLKINGQTTYASWSIASSSTDSTFNLTGVTSSLGDYYADTVLTPFKADGLTNVAIAQIGNFKVFIDISSGTSHTCAIVSDTTLKCWGYNFEGQLGDGSSGTGFNRVSPVNVRTSSTDATDLTGVTAIGLGQKHSCAILSGGAMKCWGSNNNGQLGDSTTVQRISPVYVRTSSSDASNLTGVTTIDLGERHTCAILSGGAMKCWGNNDNGQLGDGTSGNSRTSPVSVTGLTGATATAVGYFHTCALLSDTTVKCWGYGGGGQLGSITAGSTSPVNVRTSSTDASNLTGVTAIASGFQHACALLSNGTVKCWGYNGYGQLGDGTYNARTSPVLVTGLTGVTAIAASQYHTCALISGGTMKCWGYNYKGELGDGSTTVRTSPVSVTGLTGVTAISTGDFQTCARLSTNFDGIKCWGWNYYGQLGIGTYDVDAHTSPAVSVKP